MKNITVVVDSVGTNILNYKNRYLFIPVKLNTLCDNKY